LVVSTEELCNAVDRGGLLQQTLRLIKDISVTVDQTEEHSCEGYGAIA
jgi:hypothetical protein